MSRPPACLAWSYFAVMWGHTLGLLARIVFRVRLDGDRMLLSSTSAKLFVANHSCVIDPILVGAVLPGDVIVIASNSSFRSRMCRFALSGREAFAADLSDVKTVRRIVRLIARGRSVVVFPENRVARVGAAMKIYEAPAIVAARTGVPVVPLHIHHGVMTSDGRRTTGTTIRVGRGERIELAAGLPARERRRQATDRLLDLTQRASVDARPRQTLFESFMDAVERYGAGTRIVEDVRQIEESYGTLLKVTLALARLITRVSEEREVIGVLLPNTVAAVGTLLGASAMNRVPAMLNYSSGTDAIRSSVRVAGIRTILTSRRFVEAARLDRLIRALDGCAVYYLEDLRAGMSIIDKLWLVGWALRAPRRVARCANCHDLAVVLFTSGSEGKPKGVALSHDGMLANMAQLAAAIDFWPSDKFLNALPMYHTYGLIACTLMPIMRGTRLFLYTNPLHYRIIPEIAYSRDCTYLFGTSTFLGNYAKHARNVDFGKMRYVISGGEKLNPDVVRTYQERFGLRVLEGYGSTECGPAICLNTPQRYKLGTVGRFLPGAEYRLVPVNGIERGGLLHVRSPNLMLGYFLDDRPGEIQVLQSAIGEGWHSMGDVVDIDPNGFVSVLGRLKRFAKVAGEMVALELVERVARECSPEHQHAATVAVAADRGEITVLFTTDAKLDRMRLHHVARALELQDLVVARSIVHVKALPVLGSGKTDYVALSELARNAPSADQAARVQVVAESK